MSAQIWVESVWTPIGASSSVEVSSVVTEMNTSAAAEPMPDAATGSTIRQATAQRGNPSDRPASSRLGRNWPKVARMLTMASGMNRMA